VELSLLSLAAETYWEQFVSTMCIPWRFIYAVVAGEL